MYSFKRVEVGNTDLPIRLVCATRHTLSSFEDTMLAKSIDVFSNIFGYEILLEPENTKPLGEVYNEAIELSKNDPAILVFVHDDVLITEFFWNKKLRRGLNKFDIVGLAGTTRRHPKQCGWSLITKDPDEHDTFDYLSGIVSHGTSYPPRDIGYFGKVGKKCKLLDGLFLAADSRTLIDNNIRFDTRFKFHFYDMDFCRQAELKNLTMGTVSISVVHGSIDKPYDNSWYEMYDEYLKKWKE